MPWQEACSVELRYEFIRDWMREGDVSALARRHGISRKTAYKWIDRFQSSGRSGLSDLPRRPHGNPRATSPEVIEALIHLRRKHPSWGGKKLVARLMETYPSLVAPAVSTASEILQRAGLVRPRRCRRRYPEVGRPWPRADRANAIWCVDYKGQFKTGDGQWCYPLTISDEFSRYVLACRGYGRIDGGEARRCFEGVFRRHGLPESIRSDNGSPFAGVGLCRLSRLSVWWLRLGISLKRTVPGHPEQNGRHERMHRDLKAQTTKPPKEDLKAQQRRFDAFRHEYNQIRPHEALGQQQPARHYQPSLRQYPERLPTVEYPSHYQVRRVGANGCVSWCGDYVFLSEALIGELVGLIEQEEDRWAVYYGDLRLGVIDQRTRKLADLEDYEEVVDA